MTDSTNHRPIRSFVLRQGRLTKGQQDAMDHLWPVYGIEASESVLDTSTLFSQVAPLTLEIGFGNGESLASMAKASPDRNFIGIEVHTPGVGHLLYLTGKYELQNLRVMNTDAVAVLKNNIAPESIDRLQLYFPDPWHKKRHNKRRIVQQDFIDLVASRLTPNGVFHMATDWEPYAEHMAEEMETNQNFKRTNPESPFSARPEFRPETKFERRGINKGHGVWDLLYQKA